MNKCNIDTARNSDLRYSRVALERAAQRAADLARTTCTDLIVAEDGVVRRLAPGELGLAQARTDRASES